MVNTRGGSPVNTPKNKKGATIVCTPKTTASKSESCTDCKADLRKSKAKSIACDVCDNWFCLKCSKLTPNVFNDISDNENILWSCSHCKISLPGWKKVLTSISTLEEKFKDLENQLKEMKGQSNCNKNNDSVQEVVHEILAEEREVENRKLNIIVHSLSEDPGHDDKIVIEKILNDTLKCNVAVGTCARLGDIFPGRTNARPIKITMKDFDSKRKVLESAKKLKNNKEHSNVYFTPDLTKLQRRHAFELREEKRTRERNGEANLAIRKGRVVVLPPNVRDHSYSGRREGSEATSGGSGPSRPFRL